MKKLLVVLLSLGLIAAFGMTASAASVTFSGSYYVVGLYDNNSRFADTDNTFSRAFYYQRIRIQPVFQIAEGLTFTSRFDAMEKQWGQTDWRGGFDDKDSSRRQQQSFGNPKIQESFEWERGYVTFMTKVGQFDIGYQSSGKFGTDFGDDEQSRPRIKYTTKMGNFTFLAVVEKKFEADTSSQAGFGGKVDADFNQYSVSGIFSFKGGQTGLLFLNVASNANRPALNFKTNTYSLVPYIKATFGPVYLESELNYTFGKAREFDNGTADVDQESYGAYLKAQVNLGPAYVGGSFLYSSGDNGGDPGKSKTGPSSQDLDVGLILGNDALQTWENTSGNGGANGFAFDSGKQNSMMYSLFAGYRATPKMSVQAMLVYAELNKTPSAIAVNKNDSKKLGWEADITASYKLYDNLTYMVGAGYLWTGDAFKGFGANSNANKVGNDYLLMNRISLSF